MNRFVNLFRRETPPSPGEIYADDRSDLFPAVVAESTAVELWPLGRTIPETGTFMLLGVATWSGYDMKLLDEIEVAADRPDVVGVFDMQEAETDDFSNRMPGLRGVVQGPVVGVWKDGQLIESGSGYKAQDIAFKACHIDPDEIADRLDYDTPVRTTVPQ